MGRLPYFQALHKIKLISIKNWIQSTDYKKMSVLWFPFMARIYKDIIFNLVENIIVYI